MDVIEFLLEGMLEDVIGGILGCFLERFRGYVSGCFRESDLDSKYIASLPRRRL